MRVGNDLMAVEAISSAPQTYTLRPYSPELEAFVLSGWLKSHRCTAHWARCVTDATYFGHRHGLATELLQRSRCLVAYDQEPQPIGCIVWEPQTKHGPALHWVYVLIPFRRQGIGRALLDATGLPRDLDRVNVTHATRLWFHAKGKPGLEAKFPRAVNNPDLPWSLLLEDARCPQK
jgi:GNAT superfamily N-acetyltransferase